MIDTPLQKSKLWYAAVASRILDHLEMPTCSVDVFFFPSFDGGSVSGISEPTPSTSKEQSHGKKELLLGHLVFCGVLGNGVMPKKGGDFKHHPQQLRMMVINNFFFLSDVFKSDIHPQPSSKWKNGRCFLERPMIPLSKLDHLEVSGMDIYIYIYNIIPQEKSIPWNEVSSRFSTFQ